MSILLDEGRKEREEKVVAAKELKLRISRLARAQLAQEGFAIAGDELSSHFDDVHVASDKVLREQSVEMRADAHPLIMIPSG